MNKITFGAVAALGAMALPVTAMAASLAITTGNVNLRAGPSTGYPVVDVARAGDEILVYGCLAERAWCDVDYDGLRGWMSSNYLAFYQGGQRYVGPQAAYRMQAPVITFSFGSYWDRHYRSRPFYRERSRWENFYRGRRSDSPAVVQPRPQQPRDGWQRPDGPPVAQPRPQQPRAGWQRPDGPPVAQPRPQQPRDGWQRPDGPPVAQPRPQQPRDGWQRQDDQRGESRDDDRGPNWQRQDGQRGESRGGDRGPSWQRQDGQRGESRGGDRGPSWQRQDGQRGESRGGDDQRFRRN